MLAAVSSFVVCVLKSSECKRTTRSAPWRLFQLQNPGADPVGLGFPLRFCLCHFLFTLFVSWPLCCACRIPACCHLAIFRSFYRTLVLGAVGVS